MKKVVASLILASLVSSSVSAVDVVGAVRSTAANTSEYVKANPKTVGSVAAGLLVVGAALTAYKNPEGRAGKAFKSMDPRRWALFNASSSEKDSLDPADSNGASASNASDE